MQVIPLVALGFRLRRQPGVSTSEKPHATSCFLHVLSTISADGSTVPAVPIPQDIFISLGYRDTLA